MTRLCLEYMSGKICGTRCFRLLAAVAMIVAGAVWMSAADYRQLSNLPTVYVETEGRADITSKETYLPATLRYVDADGETLYDALGIRGRGNSTWGLAKKPYRIKFDKKQEFLGPERAKAKSWTLLANHADKTLIRNAVTSCIGSFAGQPFTAAAQFVDLVVNGTYQGNYQISDQIEIRKKRVDIFEQEEPASRDADISGGYLLEVDGFAYGDPVNFHTDRGVFISVKSPDSDVINQRQKTYIRNHINKFESALFSDRFTDPVEGYRQYVDSLTLASWYISSELTGNPDCFWSTYIYKERGDDKIYWGPLWDYDIAFNNCDRVGDVSRELMVNRAFADDLAKLWVKRMWEDPWFVALIDRTWRQLVEDGIEAHILDYIDTVSALIEESQKLNFAKWPINQHVYNELVLFSSYAEGVDYLKWYITEHVAYLTETFAAAAAGTGDAPVPTPVFFADASVYYLIANYGSGNFADCNGAGVVMNGRNDGNAAQQWALDATSDGWFRIVNRDSGLAITDMAGTSGNSYAPGAQLELKIPDGADDGQLWKAVPVASGGRYVLVNRKTSLAWNNSGGSTAGGNPIISWRNDGENEYKPTRQWLLTPDEPREAGGISATDLAPEYMVTYTPGDRTLRFRTAPGAVLPDGVLTVYSAAGMCVWTGAVAAETDLSSLAPGVYVVIWQTGAREGSAKLSISNW